MSGSPPPPAAQSGLPAQATGWSISDEREFSENLLGQRFNFFLVFVGLIAAAFAASGSGLLGLGLLLVGTVVATMLLLTLERSQFKLEVLLELLAAEPSHPVALTNAAAAARQMDPITRLLAGRSRNRLIGSTIPRFVTLCLIVGTVADAVVLITRP